MSVHFQPNHMSYIKCSFLEFENVDYLLKITDQVLNTGSPDYASKTFECESIRILRAQICESGFIRFLHRQYDTTDQTNHTRLSATIIVKDFRFYRIFSFF